MDDVVGRHICIAQLCLNVLLDGLNPIEVANHRVFLGVLIGPVIILPEFQRLLVLLVVDVTIPSTTTHQQLIAIVIDILVGLQLKFIGAEDGLDWVIRCQPVAFDLASRTLRHLRPIIHIILINNLTLVTGQVSVLEQLLLSGRVLPLAPFILIVLVENLLDPTISAIHDRLSR